MAISLFIDVWNLSIMFPCFLFGCYVRYNQAWMNKLESFGVFSASLFVLLFAFSDRDVFKIPIGITGAFAFICLFCKLFNGLHLLPSNSVNYLIDMGKHTLGVYLVQTVILEMILPSILHLHSFDTLMGHLFLVPLISLLTLIVCDVVTRICYRNRYISLLFMGK